MKIEQAVLLLPRLDARFTITDKRVYWGGGSGSKGSKYPYNN